MKTIVATMILALGFAPPLAAQVLVKNAGFEDGISHWVNFWKNTGSSSTELSHSGAASGCITHPENFESGWHHAFEKLEPGVLYRISAYAYRDNDTVEAKVWGHTGRMTSGAPVSRAPTGRPLAKVKEWEHIWNDIQMNSRGHLTVNLFVRGAGSVWWDDVSVSILKTREQRKEELQAVIQSDETPPDEKVAAIFSLGEIRLWAENAPAAALPLYEQALELAPDDLRTELIVTINLAEIARMQEDYDTAIKHYTRVLELDPDDKAPQLPAHILGEIYDRQQIVHNVLADVYSRQGVHQQAVSHARRYIELVAGDKGRKLKGLRQLRDICIRGELHDDAGEVTELLLKEQLVDGKFVNVTDIYGLTGMGNAAVSWADYDCDGWVDLYLSGKVWHNDKGTQFTPVDGVALPISVTVGDHDNDGWPDVAGWQEGSPNPPELRRYDGAAKKWENQSSKFTGRPVYRSFASAWGDFNNDGYLDFYQTGMTKDSAWPAAGTNDFIWFSDKAESFELTWTSPAAGNTRAVTVSDFDRDGDLDVYTSNYWMTTDRLWQNDGKGNFTDVAGTLGIPNVNGHGNGSAWGDFDNDGWIDLYVSNFSHSGNPPPAFARNLEGRKFENKGAGGIAWVESQGAAAAADFDNDGDLDLFLTAVYTPRCRLMRNDGDFKFVDVSERFGLTGIGPTYQAGWGDFNNDGYLDLVAHGKLLRNPGGDNHWLKVKLVAKDGTINASAVGGQVRIAVPGSGTLTRQVETATGQGNQNELTMHFGIGSYDGALTLDVFWPDGQTTEVAVDGVDRLVVIDR